MSGRVRLPVLAVDADVPEQCPRRAMRDNGPRLCPFTLCTHHRLHPPQRGPVKRIRVRAGEDTCSLDVATRGPSTEREIATWLNCAQPTVNNAIKRALRKLARRLKLSPEKLQTLLDAGR